MSCGRGEGKTTPQELYLAKKNIHVDRILGIDVGGYNLFVKMCREYAFNWLMFEQAVQLHWNRTYAPTPVHLLRLKKPILPERWRGPREGWIQWSELLINPGITIKDMPDLQSEPLTAKKIYDAIQKMEEKWRLK